MSYGPFWRSPFTDLTGSHFNHQNHGKCAEFEMKMMDCLEAYGTERGKKKCFDLIMDYEECSSRKKQLRRLESMRFERRRQYWTGERKEQYAKPPTHDSY